MRVVIDTNIIVRDISQLDKEGRYNAISRFRTLFGKHLIMKGTRL